MAQLKATKPQLVFLFVASSILTHVLGDIQPISAAGTSNSNAETTSSSQPLWSYQVKPNGYANVPNVGANPYANNVSPGYGPSSIFDTLNGLSQRQGALTGSPFLSILPIILIAAGGMLLLLPLLTMMMASPFGGGGFGGYNNGFGYPQVGALNKKRSLGGERNGLIDLIEHVSSSIEEMSKKYSPSATNQQPTTANGSGNKRAKSSANHQPANEVSQNAPPSNHRTNSPGETPDNVVSNTLTGGS